MSENPGFSDPEQPRDTLKESAQVTALIRDIAVALVQTHKLQATINNCAEAIVRHLDAAFARVWTLNKNENVLELQASVGMYTHLDGPHSRVPVGKYKIGLIAQERKPHLTNSVVGDPRVHDQEWARREGMVSFAGFPLIVENRLVGVIATFARHPLSEAVLEAMSSVANAIALGIEHKQAEAALEEQREVVETINRVGQLLSAELNQQKLVQAVTDAATEITGARFGSFFYNVVDSRGESYMLYTLSGVPREAFSHFPMPRATDLFGPTFRGEGTILIPDVKRDPRYGNNSPYFGMPEGHLPVTSYLAVPVISRSSKVIGGLFFGHPDVGVFTKRHGRIVEGLAAQTAVAMDNARLFEAAQRAVEVREQALELHRNIEQRLSLLVQASGTLIGSPVLSEVLPAILTISRKLVEADAYAVWRHDSPNKEWRILSAFGLSDTFRQSAVPAATDGVGSNFDSPLVAEDVYVEPMLAGRRDLHALERVRSLVAIPLKIAGEFSGTLTFYYREPHSFSELEIRVATALSNMAAAAITSAELYEEQVRIRDEAEAANRAKDEFLATVSHELRTPLNAIMGWTQILRRGEYDEDALRHAVETIERNSKSQAQLINDILDVSRIITGNLRLEVRPVEVASVIKAAVDTVRPAAEAKEIKIQTLLDSGAGPVSGDAGRLQQVVWNLLSNAVKFTPKGGRVQVRLELADSHLEVIISDTGKGIRQDFLPYVFDRFRQADSSASRTQGGLGLGLAIVRHLVELHGGTVRAYSDGEGEGSTFTVSLPLMLGLPRQSYVEPLYPADDQVLSSESLPSLQGLKVMVVDDEADARELLKAMLRPCGAEVLTASSAAEALESVRRWKPDLIVSDIGMPGEDGYRLIRRIRALEASEGGRTPAIALTAYARSADRVRALASGYQLHVPKPVEVQELAMAIASLAGRTGKQ
jgi:signal transduction histidine kinase/ActR/RegA family two-component response regulator